MIESVHTRLHQYTDKESGHTRLYQYTNKESVHTRLHQYTDKESGRTRLYQYTDKESVHTRLHQYTDKESVHTRLYQYADKVLLSMRFFPNVSGLLCVGLVGSEALGGKVEGKRYRSSCSALCVQFTNTRQGSLRMWHILLTISPEGELCWWCSSSAVSMSHKTWPAQEHSSLLPGYHSSLTGLRIASGSAKQRWLHWRIKTPSLETEQPTNWKLNRFSSTGNLLPALESVTSFPRGEKQQQCSNNTHPLTTAGRWLLWTGVITASLLPVLWSVAFPEREKTTTQQRHPPANDSRLSAAVNWCYNSKFVSSSWKCGFLRKKPTTQQWHSPPNDSRLLAAVNWCYNSKSASSSWKCDFPKGGKKPHDTTITPTHYWQQAAVNWCYNSKSWASLSCPWG